MNKEEKIISFIRDASAKNKTVGHNKYQIQIQELNTNIEQLTKQISELESENTELKNTIANLQENNLKYSNEINYLNTKINVSKDVIDTLQYQLQEYQDSHKTQIADLINENDTVKSNHSDLLNRVAKINDNKDTLGIKYTEIKQQYKTLLDNFTIKTNENLKLTDLVNENQKTNLMYKENNLKLQTKVDFIKDSLDKILTVNLQLQNDLQSKDNVIGQLHLKYSKEQPVKTDDPDTIEEIEIIETPLHNKGIKIANRCKILK